MDEKCHKKYRGFRSLLRSRYSPELVSKNNRKFSNAKILFKNFDIVADDIPQGFDIILVRDVFIHLENTCIKFNI